jgi:hypothetical protein
MTPIIPDHEEPANQGSATTRIPLWQLLQWKAAIRLERLGMKHSSGRSVRKHAAEALGMRPMAPASAVLSRIQALIDIGSWQR